MFIFVLSILMSGITLFGMDLSLPQNHQTMMQKMIAFGQLQLANSFIDMHEKKQLSRENLEELLVRTICVEPLFGHVTRKVPQFGGTSFANIGPQLHPLEARCYHYMSKIPFRCHGKDFYVENSENDYQAIFCKFNNVPHDAHEHVMVKWMNTQKSQGNRTREFLNTLSEEPITHYVILPQTRLTHSNMVITRLAPQEKPVAFLIDSCGTGHSIRYLNEKVDTHVAPTNHNNIGIHHQNIVLIDASLNDADKLQYIKNLDFNCHLYVKNYVKAAKHFFKDNSSKTFKIFELLCKQERFEEAGKILHKGLKQYLPMYFQKDENGCYIKKNNCELAHAHLLMRWKLGNDYLHQCKAQMDLQLQARQAYKQAIK